MAGMTSQPSMGAIVACTKGTKLDTGGSQTEAALTGAKLLAFRCVANQTRRLLHHFLSF